MPGSMIDLIDRQITYPTSYGVRDTQRHKSSLCDNAQWSRMAKKRTKLKKAAKMAKNNFYFIIMTSVGIFYVKKK